LSLCHIEPCSVFRQGTHTPFTTRPCWAHTNRSSQLAPRRALAAHLERYANMRILILTLLLLSPLAAYAGGPKASPKHKDGCCGLSQAQWDSYYAAAAKSATNATVWAEHKTAMPKEAKVDTHRKPWGTTNSPDSIKPPTKVTIYVPIIRTQDGFTEIVVEFTHAAGTIQKIHATQIVF
jgi:hypothetical protein